MEDDLISKLQKVNEVRLNQMLAAVQDVTDEASVVEKFDECVLRIRELSSDVDPIALLSIISSHNLVNLDLTSKTPELDNPERLQQFHVELLQALILQLDKDTHGQRPVLPHHEEEIHSILIKLSTLAILYRAIKLRQSKSEEDRDKGILLESVRMTAQILRNAAYPQQIEQLTKELFVELNDLIEKNFQLDCDILVDLIFKIVDEVEERLTRHFECLANAISSIANSGSVQEAIEAYSDLFGEFKEEVKEEYLKDKNLKIKDLVTLAFSFIDNQSLSIFLFDLGELARLSARPIEVTQLKLVLDRWTIKVGELNESDPKKFILENPVLSKPFVLLDEDVYFCPIAGALITSCFSMIEGLVENLGESEKERYHDRRGAYLEQKTAELFRTAFPSARFATNAEWGIPGDNGETDVIGIIEPYLFIIECKGHRPSEASQRGAPKSVEDTITKIINEPTGQSKRFEDWLNNNPGIHHFECTEGSIELDTRSIKTVVRLNTCIEALPGKLSNWQSIKRAGFVQDITEGAPTIPISDLECVFDVLETQSQRLHYLVQRQLVENETSAYADELGLLYVYLSNSLLDSLPEEFNDFPMIELMAFGLEDYFMQRWTGRDVPRPRHNITDRTKEILCAVERLPQGVRVGTLLLDLGFAGQLEADKRIEAVIKRVKNAEVLDESVSNVFRIRSSDEKENLVFVAIAYRDNPDPEKFIASIMEEQMEKSEADLVFGIGFNVDDVKFPFNLCALTLIVGPQQPQAD